MRKQFSKELSLIMESKSGRIHSVLVIECKDKAVKMTGACKSKYFKEVKDSDINGRTDRWSWCWIRMWNATTVTHKQLVQYNATDWDFMLCRCDANGLLCLPDDGKLKITKPRFCGSYCLNGTIWCNCHDLDAEIDARLQYKSVKGTMWDYTDRNC